MADFKVFRLVQGETALQPLEHVCEDFAAVRTVLKQRGRSANEQLVVMHQGLIYAVERRDGDGFSMVRQDLQNQEDQVWYPNDR